MLPPRKADRTTVSEWRPCQDQCESGPTFFSGASPAVMWERCVYERDCKRCVLHRRGSEKAVIKRIERTWIDDGGKTVEAVEECWCDQIREMGGIPFDPIPWVVKR